jgi:hypothetical protein
MDRFVAGIKPVTLDDCITPLRLALECVHVATQLLAQVGPFLPGCVGCGVLRDRVRVTEHAGLTFLGLCAQRQ